ncbi:hypothetical protein J2X87_002735 [Pseudomonas synxantha]|uniref:Uncharacterized protein n=1 Tax=Pseudomonas synxantha TaxID=47883 RepID=A0ACC6JN55_9PSED|nr:hypothetical protein [Pseudomonas synxantha]
MSGEKRRGGVGCSAVAFLWKRACSRRRPASRPGSTECTRSNCRSEPARDGGLPADQLLTGIPNPPVGAGLLAKTACQPTNFHRMYSVQLWERACSRRRPASQPISTECTRSNCGSGLAREDGPPADQFPPNVLGPIVGAGLLAKTACQPTYFHRMYSVQLWERACSRRRPASQPISTECTRSNCGSEPARDGCLPVDQLLTGIPNPPVGAGLLAKTACQPTHLSQTYSIQLCEPDSRRFFYGWAGNPRPLNLILLHWQS